MKLYQIVLIAALTITTVLSWMHYSLIANQDEENFRDISNEIYQKLEQRMVTYEQVLIGAKGLQLASNEVEWDEWEKYVISLELEDRFSDPITVAYVPVITDDELESFTLNMRKTFPSYNVHPDTKESIHFPLMFISPFNERLISVLGLDNNSEPKRQQCVTKSRDTGHAIMSNIIILNQDKQDPQNAVLICIPVYEKETDPQTLEERREHITGFVTLAFHIKPLLKSVIEEESKLNLYVFENNVDSSQLIYSHINQEVTSEDKTHQRTMEFNALDKSWDLVFEHKDDSLYLTVIVFLVLGYIVSIVIFFVLRKSSQTQENLIKTNLKLEASKRVAKMLKKTEEMKDDFSSMISHELKTPLFPIQGYCEMLKDPKMPDPLTVEQTDIVSKIQKNAVHLERLISDMLDVQKLDAQRMKFRKDSIGMKKFAKNLESDLKPLMNEKQIDLIVEVADITMRTDEQRLGQVITNLVRNAVDFVSERGKIQIKVEDADADVIFSVKDNGIGMEKELLNHLFDKYYQVDTSIKRKHGGTGLGLSICKGIVENLGGKIWVESEVGKGSTFFFTIPKE